VAWRALRSSEGRSLPTTPEDEPLGHWVGQLVSVTAGSADRGGASGLLLAVDHEQVVLAVEPLAGVEAQVWFPRFGYHVGQVN